MKFECLKEKITRAVSKADKVTAKNSSLASLKSIYIEAKKNEVILRSTNLEIGLEIILPAKVEQEGIVVVAGSTLNQVLNAFEGNKTVELSLTGDVLTLKTSTQESRIKTLSADDFPTIPKAEGDNTFSIDISLLNTGLKSVWFSASVSTIKPELSSIKIWPDQNDGTLVFVATDHFRLAEKRIKVQKIPDFTSILLPARNATEIIRLFDDLEGTVDIVVDQNQISFTFSGEYTVRVVSRIVEGNFYDYVSIIPKEYSSEVVFLKKDVQNAFKVASLFSDKFFHSKFVCDAVTSTLTIQTKNTEVGDSSSEVSCKVNGDSFDVNFNYRYILEAFQSVGTESVCFNYNSTKHILIITPVGDTSFRYLVKPMNK